MSSQAPMVYRQSGPNLLIRVIWFLLIGWWAGAMVSGLAWVLNCTIIGLPVGLWIINRLPSIITLRPQETSLYVNARGQVTGIPQRSFLGRAIWFLLIGWWLSGVWMALAYVCLLTILLIPISFWMYGRVGAVTTLYRS
ncbi:hypothetical protein LBMAG38_06590 [Chloroflexota bacterium]|nr:hypothetical protein LBMAG38_06590 [Chloroflexota bacterium]